MKRQDSQSIPYPKFLLNIQDNNIIAENTNINNKNEIYNLSFEDLSFVFVDNLNEFELRYTLDGSDPANGNFYVLEDNKFDLSMNDNIVSINARNYQNGKWSSMSTIYFSKNNKKGLLTFS